MHMGSVSHCSTNVSSTLLHCMATQMLQLSARKLDMF